MRADELILVCQCGNKREAMPFETMLAIGGSASGFCNQCRKVTKHTVTLPAEKPELEKRA